LFIETGYYVADTINLLVEYFRGNKGMIIWGSIFHHLVMFAGVTNNQAFRELKDDKVSDYVKSLLIATNGSTWLLNLKWYMDIFKYDKRNMIYKMTFAAYFVVFTALRFGMWPLAFRCFINQKNL